MFTLIKRNSYKRQLLKVTKDNYSFSMKGDLDGGKIQGNYPRARWNKTVGKLSRTVTESTGIEAGQKSRSPRYLTVAEIDLSVNRIKCSEKGMNVIARLMVGRREEERLSKSVWILLITNIEHINMIESFITN